MPFVVYSSSAGSGKTFTLVKEYLKLVLSREDRYRRILAVTFTNKAAEEMKNRILEALAGIAANEKESDKLLTQIIDETGIPREQLIRSADKVLNFILHDYADFAVGTIDSFVHNIIRTFARDLRLSWNFDVETDEDRIMSETVDALMQSVGIDEELTQTLAAFAEDTIEDEKNWNIDFPIKSLAGKVLKDNSSLPLSSLASLTLEDFTKIRRVLVDFVRQFENRINASAREALLIIESNHIDVTSFYHGKSGLPGYLNHLSGKFQPERLTPNTYVKETIENGKWYASKTARSEQNKIDSVKKKLETVYWSIQGAVNEHLSNYILSTLIIQRLYALSLLNRIHALMRQRNLEANRLLISEFNKRVHEVVASEPIPFIFERLGEKYEHYLIDEFQDTSELQWSNLLPLVENSLASDHFNMVVGDGKQAIYRFRNGDVEQFNALPSIKGSESDPILAERERSLKRGFELKRLDTNYRSAPEIVTFNNDFYSYFSADPAFEFRSIYRDQKQKHRADLNGGYVRIEFLDLKNSPEPDQLLFDHTVELIASLLSKGHAYKDIALLTRANADASRIAEHLIQRNIPVISAESILLNHSPEVRFILAVLRFIVEPDDAIARAEMLCYLCQKNQVTDQSLHYFFQSSRELGRFFDTISGLGYKINFKELSYLSLYEIAENLIVAFNLNKTTNLLLSHFLDALLSFSIKEGNSPEEFLKWWDEHKEKLSASLPEGIDAVQVLTIHKAKGLEFPVVILPKATWSTDESEDDMWISPELPFAPALSFALISFKKDLRQTSLSKLYENEKAKTFLDHLNLLYVATTRAKEKLYVICEEMDKMPAGLTKIHHLFLRYLNSLTIWEPGKTVYGFGEERSPTGHGMVEKGNVYSIRSLPTHSWRDKLVIRKTRTISDNERTQAERGRMLHAALARIRSIDDIRPAVEYLCRIGSVEREKSQELVDELNDILHQPHIRPFFEKGLNVRTEAEMKTREGAFLRADRIILNGQAVTVIDYKTGHIPREEHVTQLNGYTACIRDMGYSQVEAFLLYTEDKRLEKI